jgi:hypothetical protein
MNLDRPRKADNPNHPLILMRGFIVNGTIIAVFVIVLIAIAALWAKRWIEDRQQKRTMIKFNCSIAQLQAKEKSQVYPVRLTYMIELKLMRTLEHQIKKLKVKSSDDLA